MAAPQIPEDRLITGLQMTREEFLRRWDALPGLKKAELIEGIVYVPSPVSTDHGIFDGLVGGWLSRYAWATQGCRLGHNSTWMILESAPQPDVYLTILPEYGGQWRIEGKFASGAPELAVEICLTSTEVDFGPKLALYQRAGVREYITVELFTKRIVWRVLEGGSYRELNSLPEGVFRSRTFPGLWLNPTAFWAYDTATMDALLQQGLTTEEHAAFVQRLKSNYRG
ncbi:MAG: Uma2 family endonuclease [Bryobacteraceae bacterium]